MLEQLITYLSDYIATGQPDSVHVYGLAHRLRRIEETTRNKEFPAIYCANDEYHNIEHDVPFLYIRQRAAISETEANEDDAPSGCDDTIVRTYPMTLVGYIPKNIYNRDNAYSDERISGNIANTIDILSWKALITALQVSDINLNIRNIDTDRWSVWAKEYKEIPMAARLDHAYFSIDFDLSVTAVQSCLRNYECGDEPINPNPCANLKSTAILKDSEGNVISVTLIQAGAIADILAPDATAYLENSEGTPISTTTIVSNGSEVIIAPDATAVLKNTAGTILLTESIPSNVSEDVIAPDATVLVNGDNSFPTIPSGGLENIGVENTNGAPVGSFDVNTNSWVVGDSVVTLRDTANNVLSVTNIAATDNEDIIVPDWTRPSDWLPMPNVTASEQKFVGLYAIFPQGNNFATALFTTSANNFQVDWGDGTVLTYASNTTAEHTYDFATYDPTNTTLTSRGYKQAFITITPVSGNLLTCNFQQRFTGQNQNYATGFLDCILSMPNASSGQSIIFGGTTIRHAYCERVNVLTIGACTSMLNMFTNCSSLVSVPLFNTTNITTMQNMFLNCFSLVNAPFFNTANVTNMVTMFQNCNGLQNVPLYNTASVTNMGVMFSGCSSLRSVPLFNTALVASMANMFRTCNSLQFVPLFNTTNVTNMGNFFDNCASLQSIPALSTAAISPTAGSDFLVGFAQNCASLDRCEMVFARTVGFANCQLGVTQLVEIFTNLVDRSLAPSSANINITGNFGAPLLSVAQRDIALNKNWTITG
jgi:hypothetical protein